MKTTEDQIKMQQALTTAKSIQCECGSVLFKQALVIKEVSKFLLGTPENVIVPIPIYRCDDCGRIIEDLVPKNLNIFNEEEEQQSENKSGLII